MARTFLGALLASSALSFAAPAMAQASTETNDQASADRSYAGEVIVVTARRREENVQDVPAVIDTVSFEDIAELNLRDFTEVQALVPGLELRNEANGLGSSAQIRGVAFDINASTQPSVDFYLNDAPIDGPLILQGMFDVGQIEVSRGPQGTLRGRSSPSGAIVVGTKKPDLYQIGGNFSATANDIGGFNFNGGVSFPLIEGVLGLRIAGLYTEGDANRVKTINTDVDGRGPHNRTESFRASLVIEPADFLRFEGVYQRSDVTRRSYDPYVSFNLIDPTSPVSPMLITPKDRLSIQETPRLVDQVFDIYNWRAEGRFGGQVLIYQGQLAESDVHSRTNLDGANFFDGFDTFKYADSFSRLRSHEIRLQNEERVFGFLDYVGGYFYQKRKTPTDLLQQDAVQLPPNFGGGFFINELKIHSPDEFKENSFFGNLTAHIGDRFELSAGARHLHFQSPAGVITVGSNNIPGARKVDEKDVIYNLSAKYSISPDVMIYANTGTSRRPGPTIVGVFSVQQSDLMRSFISLDSETSQSYELGLKSTLFDGKLRFNITGYYQEFDNYAYKLTSPVFFRNFTYNLSNFTIVETIGNDSQFAAAVPLEVKGIEMQLAATPFDNFDVSLVAAYADGKVKNGLIPCNDLDGDGVPDSTTTTPTVAQLQAAYPTDYIGSCRVSIRSSNQPPFSATLQASYTVPLNDKMDAFGRGLFNFLGKSRNVPTNAFDDIGAYGLLNLYAGVRDPQGAWEVSFFAKNILDTTKVTSVSGPGVTGYQIPTGPASAIGAAVTSTYGPVGLTAPREFGINLRYSFGSR